MVKAKSFDYQGAIDAGYTDEEITPFLREQMPNFDYDNAVKAGYLPSEINEFMASYKPEKSVTEKVLRGAEQFGLGILQGSPSGMAYDLAVAPLASEDAQQVPYRENAMADIERLEEQKMSGIPLDEQDQALYNSLINQIKNPKEAAKNIKTADLTIRGLAEKVTGQNLEPEGMIEKGLNWAGMLKNSRNIVEAGLKPKELMKALLPTGTEFTRSVGAGAALQMAEDGEFGPIGTIVAAVAGDLLGHGVGKSTKAAVEFAKAPKEYMAKQAAKLTSVDKVNLQKAIIQDFRDSGIQADLGAITDSSMAKWMNARLAQSGLTGKALDSLKENLTNQVKQEYKNIADSLGNMKYETAFEAGESARKGIEKIREADLQATREMYQNADAALNQNSYVAPNQLAKSIEKLEANLKPGAIKSGEQKAVLDALEKLKADIYDSEGNLMMASVKDLMNNKIALNDIINYEVQGGAKQLLKGVVGDLDRAIISHGKTNPGFAKEYIKANKRFSEHAKTFRNKDIKNLLNTGDPAQIINRMNSVQGIRNLQRVLSKTPEGKQIFEGLKRFKLEKAVGDHLVDSVTNQIKKGTFSKLLEKGKNFEIIKEILGPQQFKKLQKLQKNLGVLAEANNKFFNSSQSGTVAADAAIIFKGVNDFINLLAGNPFPLMKTAGGLYGARKLAQLMADPEFLKLTEDAILAYQKGSQQKMMDSFMKMKPIINATQQQVKDQEE